MIPVNAIRRLEIFIKSQAHAQLIKRWSERFPHS
jgi:hypothetical protein